MMPTDISARGIASAIDKSLGALAANQTALKQAATAVYATPPGQPPAPLDQAPPPAAGARP